MSGAKKPVEHPHAKLRRMVEAMFAHAHAHDIRLDIKILFPDGMRVEEKSDFEPRKPKRGAA